MHLKTTNSDHAFDEPFAPEVQALLKNRVEQYRRTRKPKVALETFATLANTMEGAEDILGDEVLSRRALEGWISGDLRKDGSRHHTQLSARKMHLVAHYLILKGALTLSELASEDEGLRLAQAMQSFMNTDTVKLADHVGEYEGRFDGRCETGSIHVKIEYLKQPALLFLTARIALSLDGRLDELASSHSVRPGVRLKKLDLKGWCAALSPDTIQAHLSEHYGVEASKHLLILNGRRFDNSRILTIQFNDIPEAVGLMGGLNTPFALKKLHEGSDLSYYLKRKGNSDIELISEILKVSESSSSTLNDRSDLETAFLKAITTDVNYACHLLNRKMVDVNVADPKTGMTALMLTAGRGMEVIVEMLVEHYGADPTPRDLAGRRASNVAFQTGNSYIGGWLIDHEVDWEDARPDLFPDRDRGPHP